MIDTTNLFMLRLLSEIHSTKRLAINVRSRLRPLLKIAKKRRGREKKMWKELADVGGVK